jgi:phosphoglycolate/pyridoxal phosphate phosphatase family enzyme
MGTDKIRLVALDLDGVCYRGNVALPGVREALEDILARGLDLRYVTNNSTTHRQDVAARLIGMGLPADADRVLSSGVVTARWLRERFPAGTEVLVVGEQGLIRELAEAGLVPRHAGDDGVAGQPAASGGPAEPALRGRAAAVVVGMDRGVTYRALAEAQSAIADGALFVATNPDPTFPVPHGLAPGAGALVAAVATAAGRQPVVMGKPGLALAEALAKITGIGPESTLFIGDRLDTDVAMGEQAGMVTVLALTGATTLEDWHRHEAAGTEPRPDYVLDDLSQLAALLDRLGA